MKVLTDTANGGEICVSRIQTSFRENGSIFTLLFLQNFYVNFPRSPNQLMSKRDDKSSTLVYQCEEKAR